MNPDPKPNPATNQKVERFVKAFEQSSQVNEALLAQIAHPEDGLIASLDELTDEIRGLREDLRAFARAGGVRIDLASLFGKRR